MTASTEEQAEKKTSAHTPAQTTAHGHAHAHTRPNGKTHIIPPAKVKINDQDIESLTSQHSPPQSCAVLRVPKPDPDTDDTPEVSLRDDDVSSEIVRIENEALDDEGRRRLITPSNNFRRLVRTLQVSNHGNVFVTIVTIVTMTTS